MLDQTRLPAEEVVITLHGADDTAEAIRRLAVRGAPLIGVAAAYGLAMEVARDPAALERAAALLAGARPTARNLSWAVERVAAAGPARAREEAEAIQREDEAASEALARHGADALEAALPAGPLTVMTHCNSGALAASGRGTGLGVIAELADRRELRVLACEARPLLQGARLALDVIFLLRLRRRREGLDRRRADARSIRRRCSVERLRVGQPASSAPATTQGGSP